MAQSEQQPTGYVNPENPIVQGANEIMRFIDKFTKPPYKLNFVPGEIAQYWKCVDGYWVMYRYYKTYTTSNEFDDAVGTFPTLMPCDPEESTDPFGDPAPNANSTAAPQNNTQNPPQGSAPPPPSAGTAGSGKPATVNAPNAAPAAAALELTLPYRPLPFLPFFPSAAPPIATMCDAQSNPTAFAVDHVNGFVSRHAICTSQTLAKITVTSRPLQVQVTPDGSQAIVTSYDNGITFIDTATNQITKAIQTSSNFFPSGIAVSPEGSYALITNYNDIGPQLAVLNLATKSITGAIPLDTPFPQSVFINPDGTLAWVTYPWGQLAEVIDIMTGVVVKRIGVLEPFDVAFNATGTVAYIASGAGSVAVIDTTTYAQTASVPAGRGACDLTVSLDGHTVTVNNYLDGTITRFDTRLIPFSVTTPAGEYPRGSEPVPLR